MKFDENLAAVHAYLCADGYVINNPRTQKHKYYHIGFRNTNLTLLKDFQYRFYDYFKIKPYLIPKQRCRIGSKELYKKLTKEFESFYSWEWKMPKLNKKLVRIWLRAYFDCEGWVTCETHKNRHVGAECVNKVGINQIKEALEKLKIDSILKKRSTRNIYSMYIYGKDNIIKFKEKIGFLHPFKNQKLEKTIKDFMNYYWNFPKKRKELKEFIIEVMKKKAKIKESNKICQVISNKEENLIKLQKELNKIFNIESKVSKRINGIGTIYFELNINKQQEVKRLINHNLLNKEEALKWLRLKK